MTNATITTYLTENARYIGEQSAAAISTLTDADWPVVLAALEELNGGCTDPGIDCAVATTAETLDDFDNSRATYWSEKGSRKTIDCAGRSAVLFDRFQLRRGSERVSQVVIDFGARRVVLY
jgi:hypothetical protein